jgi:hypothetical protein
MSDKDVNPVEQVLLRFKKKPSVAGLTSEEFKDLQNSTGMNKTDLIHYALRIFYNEHRTDFADLTAEQMKIIREANPDMPEERITQRLF